VKFVCVVKAPPLPRPFNPDDFLSTLETSGPHLTTGIKGDWAGLYKKFFRSINFSEWYNMRYKEAAEKLQVLHLEVISDTVRMKRIFYIWDIVTYDVISVAV